MSESKKRINIRALCIVAVLFVAISALVLGYKVFAEGENDIVTARINYYYYIDSGDHKGAEARIAFVANMNRGSEPRREKSPDVPGYKPFIENSVTHEIDVEAQEIVVDFNEDSVVNVFYKPIDAPYQIELMQQIINTSEYTSYTIITNLGLTGSVPVEFGDDFTFGADSPFNGKTLENLFPGFTLMYHQLDTIGADGQTKFRCYYDRNTYNIYFKLGTDGHGVNPLLKQYGYQLTLAEIGTPIRSGFTFKGWAYESDPDTMVDFPVMIDGTKTFVAMWEPTRRVGYTVVFRNQDEEDETAYSYWGKWEVDDAGYPGESVVVNDDFVADCAAHAATMGLTDYQHFTVDAATTKSSNTDVTLKGDGSTIITVYYTRNSYRIWFVYAREKENRGESRFVNSDSISSDKSYYIVNLKFAKEGAPKDKTFTQGQQYHIGVTTFPVSDYPNKDKYPNPKNSATPRATGLLTLPIQSEYSSWDNYDKLVKWKFTPVEGKTGTYYVQPENDLSKYLNIVCNSSGGDQNVFLGNDPVEIEVASTKEGQYTKWTLRQYNSTTQAYCYLNDKKDNGQCATAYKDPSYWLLYEHNYEEAGVTHEYYIPLGTGDGSDNNEAYNSGTGVKWQSGIDSIPVVNIPDQFRDKLKLGTYTRSFGEGDSAEIFTYHYIELYAKYNSDIKDIWPTNKSVNDSSADKWMHDAVKGSTKYKFGSWAMNKYAPIRNSASGQGNIVGAFPTLTSDLIIDWDDSRISHYPVRYKSGGGDVKFDFVVKADFNSETEEKITDLAEIMYAWWDQSGNSSTVSLHAYEIYYEPLNGTDTDGLITDEYLGSDKDPGLTKTKTYVLDRTEQFTCAHNGNTRLQPFEYEGMECVLYKKSGNNWNLASVSQNKAFIENSKDTNYSTFTNVLNYPTGPVTLGENIWVTKLHYKRKTYSLTFNTLKAGDTYPSSVNQTNIQFEMPLSSYEPAEAPHYPEPVFEQYYEFVGWGLSDTDTEPIDWDTMAMPAYDLELFAIWKPREYNVAFYLDEEIMQDENMQDLNNNYVIYDDPNPTYGSLIDDKARIVATQFSTHAPTFINNGVETPMEFAGWFYFDSNGNLQQFDPETMTIYQDIKLFAQWTSTIPTKYAVHYKYKDTPISDDTEGYSFVGLTRTFNAKFDNQLDPDYRVHYFPKVASSSILMEQTIDGQPLANDKTFDYLFCKKIWYTVRYVEVDSNGNEIREFESEEGWSESASVTRRFKPILDYVPQKYFISKILELPDDFDENHDYDNEKPGLEKNVITFCYVRREGFKPYHIKHLLEDETGQQYGTYPGLTFRCINFVDSAADAGETITTAVQNFVGYKDDQYEVVNFKENDNNNSNISEGLLPVNGATSISFDIHSEMDGVELYIYYLKKSYPVKVTYSIDSADPAKCNEWYISIHNKAAADGVTLYDDESSETFTVEENGVNVTKYKTVYEIKKDRQKYNSVYSVEAPNISQFRLTSGRKKELRIVNEEAPTDREITSNSVGFVYADTRTITYYYNVVVPDVLGERIPTMSEEPYQSWKILTQNKETVSPLDPPTVNITAKPGLPPEGDRGFRFIGWYKGTYDDETGAFDTGSAVSDSYLSTDRLTLSAPGGETTDQYFFAVYDYVRGDLIINNTSSDEGQYFEYRVVGKDSHNSWIDMTVVLPADGTKKILDLPVGNYTVESTDWQWRYTHSCVDVAVVDKEVNPQVAEASFAPEMSKKKWLDGNGYKDNNFS